MIPLTETLTVWRAARGSLDSSPTFSAGVAGPSRSFHETKELIDPKGKGNITSTQQHYTELDVRADDYVIEGDFDGQAKTDKASRVVQVNDNPGLAGDLKKAFV